MAEVIGIIQARAGSSRLPGKVFAPLGGRPLLAALAERLATARVDEWWLATSACAEDDVTAAWGDQLGLRVQRGPLDDVLARFAAIVALRRPRWVVRVCADSPFQDAAIVDCLVAAAASAPADVGLVQAPPARLPLGYAPQLARASSIARADDEARESHHRAHVLTWVEQREKALAAPLPDAWPARPAWRWTVDTPDDLAMARAAVRAFGARWPAISYPAMVRALDRRPEIVARNRHVAQKPIEAG